ncbi:MAG: efflux transporter outer membrane subunit [Pseudomonadota bacterium]|nr:efflux transporter outer membrane subunit [Pseudomonadota bacterium]
MNAEGTRLEPTQPPAETAIGRGPVWWTALGDPAVNELAETALTANPTLDRAVAAVAEARAATGQDRAAQLPTLNFEASATKDWADTSSEQDGADQTSGDAGFSVGWEIDLFGRLRSRTTASARRLEARVADADGARLSLIADVADGTLALRACDHSRAALDSEIASRRHVLALTVERRDAGLDADIDVALSETGLATARTTLALRRQQCAELTNALVVLTGSSREAVSAVLADAPDQPVPPPLPVSLPAGVLASNPGVAAAEREVAASWADIEAARADRMPRLDLGAALAGQWLNALGSTTGSAPGSLGASLIAPLFDGGQGRAAASAAQARHEAALADLDMALRVAARDVENALAAGVSANTRIASAQDAYLAARRTLQAREAQRQAGAISEFEIEDARRQLAAALDSLIAAVRDAGQAWISLVRSAGPAVLIQENPES